MEFNRSSSGVMKCIHSRGHQILSILLGFLLERFLFLSHDLGKRYFIFADIKLFISSFNKK